MAELPRPLRELLKHNRLAAGCVSLVFASWLCLAVLFRNDPPWLYGPYAVLVLAALQRVTPTLTAPEPEPSAAHHAGPAEQPTRAAQRRHSIIL